MLLEKSAEVKPAVSGNTGKSVNGNVGTHIFEAVIRDLPEEIRFSPVVSGMRADFTGKVHDEFVGEGRRGENIFYLFACGHAKNIFRQQHRLGILSVIGDRTVRVFKLPAYPEDFPSIHAEINELPFIRVPGQEITVIVGEMEQHRMPRIKLVGLPLVFKPSKTCCCQLP